MKYINLFLMLILSFISMYILMYIMVDSFSNIFSNLNQFYMALLMTMPMLIIELLLMGSMYGNKLLNKILIIGSVTATIILIFLIRKQTKINDKEFLKSMIPHHASALLMCGEADLKDPEIKNLCKNIISSQQAEINWMKNKLNSREITQK